MILVVLQFFQQWTGINVILYYGTTLFQKMGFPSADSSIGFVLADNAINMLATLPGMWLVPYLSFSLFIIIDLFDRLNNKEGKDYLFGEDL